MAVKTLYFKNVVSNGALSLQDGGTAPATGLTTTGWTVAKTAAGNFAIMAAGAKGTSFSTTDALATPSFTASSCWRSEQPFSGLFANTNWSLAFRVRAGTAQSQTGRVRCRVWKSPNADGTGVIELTSAPQIGTTTAALSSSTSATSTVTWTPAAAIPFINEYLFVQCEWEIVVASGNINGDALFYVESAGAITTPDFALLIQALLCNDIDNFIAPAPSVSAFNYLTSAKVTDVDVPFAPTLTSLDFLLPGLLGDNDIFLIPDELDSTVTLQPMSVDDTGVAHGATFTLSLAPQPPASDDATYGAVIVPGAVTIAPPVVNSDDSIYVPELDSSYAVTTSAFASDDVIRPNVVLLMTQYLVPAALADTETIGANGATFYGDLLPDQAVLDIDVIEVPVTVVDAVTLLPTTISDVDVPYTLALSSSYALVASLNVDSDNAYAAAVVPGPVIIQPGVNIIDTELVYGGRLLAGSVVLQSNWFEDVDFLYTSTAVKGAANIGAFPYGDLDSVPGAYVTQQKAIRPLLFKETDRFFGPTIVGGQPKPIVSPPRFIGSMAPPSYMIGSMTQTSLKGSTGIKIP